MSPRPHPQEVRLLTWDLEEREKRTVLFLTADVLERPDSLFVLLLRAPRGGRVAPLLHRQKWGTAEEAGLGTEGAGRRDRKVAQTDICNEPEQETDLEFTGDK